MFREPDPETSELWKLPVKWADQRDNRVRPWWRAMARSYVSLIQPIYSLQRRAETIATLNVLRHRTRQLRDAAEQCRRAARSTSLNEHRTRLLEDAARLDAEAHVLAERAAPHRNQQDRA